MKINVLSGSNQIGGNCVEILGENSRIVLDVGVPLTDSEANPLEINITKDMVKKYLPKIADLYLDEPQKKTFLLISHAHPDHFGLVRFVNKSIPILANQITIEMLKKASRLLWDNLYDEVNFQVLPENFETEEFLIKTFSVDHSVAGACAFKIIEKKSGESLLYSGDIRVHGRENSVMKKLVEENKNVDYLVLEGTTLSRVNAPLETEMEIENKMYEIFKEDKLSVVACSPLNLDRIISIYSAALKAGKIFVIDPYTAYILESFKGKERYFEGEIPQFNSKNVKVYFAPNRQSANLKKDMTLYRYKRQKVKLKQILENPSGYVLKNNSTIFNALLKELPLEEINLVYSYWSGYLENGHHSWGEFKENLKVVHTSGHIDRENLIKLAKQIQPKNIIPIHTLNGDKYQELFGDFARIC